MGKIETKLAQMGLTLPEPLQMPHGIKMPFAWVRVRGKRALFRATSRLIRMVPLRTHWAKSEPMSLQSKDTTLRSSLLLLILAA